MHIKNEETPNKVFNLTYLDVTTLAKQGSRHPKRRLKQRSMDPAGADKID